MSFLVIWLNQTWRNSKALLNSPDGGQGCGAGVFSGSEREGSTVVGGEKAGNGALVSPGHPFTLLVLDWAHGVSRPGANQTPDGLGRACRPPGTRDGNCVTAPASRERGRAVAPESRGSRCARSGTRCSRLHFQQGSGDFLWNLRKPRQQRFPKLRPREGRGLRGILRSGEEPSPSFRTGPPPLPSRV